jgi:hypothetical protein
MQTRLENVSMGDVSKRFSLLLIVSIVTLSLLILQLASAQSTPKPSVPQFSIQVVDRSYDVPTTYYTDPYTGKQVANPGYHVDDIRVEGKIKNQHFNPYTIPNPNSTSSYDINRNIDFYYNISYRGHFGGEWRKLHGSEDVDYLKQNYTSEFTNFNASRYNALEFQDGSQVDFRVKAIIGFETWGFAGTWPYRILNGEDSGWSTILTVTISKDSTFSNTYATTIDSSPYPTLTSPQTLPTPTPTSTPSLVQHPTINTGAEPPQAEPFPTTLATATIIIVTVIGAGLMVYFKKRKSSLIKNS